MDKTVILQLKNITKKFGTKVIANNNVSLDVYKGEILSILGENGCGKTTLMNMVAGIYYPDSGKILINGEEYAVAANEEEADNAAGQYIEDSICYFNPSFLAEHSDVPEEVFEFLANKGFSNNDAYYQMIHDIDDFVYDAIEADGRGHFLNSYDSEEYEIGEYFLYRIN